jgi:predicted SAM-dependent methyltransferase
MGDEDQQSEEDRRIERLKEYLSTDPGQPPPPPVAGGALLRSAPAWVPGLVRRIGTRAVSPLARRKFERVGRNGPVRLHLGCGWTHKPGWVNVDLFATKADIVWDLTLGVPLEEGSVDVAFHEHMLEHLSLQHGFAFTRECLRVLKPGGVLRIGVPDAGLCVDSYAGRADPAWARSQATGMLAIQALFYENDHRAMYDAETLTLMCLAAGFAEAHRREWGAGWGQPSADTLERRDGTLYVEARKAS